MVIIWSFSFVLVDIAIEIVPPLSIALYRFIIASVAFLFLDLYKVFSKHNRVKNINCEPENEKYTKNEWIMVLLSSLCGVSLFFFAQYYAIQRIGPSLPALFVCLLAPVLISMLALTFFKEKLNKLKILGFIISSIGGFFLITGNNVRNLTPESPDFLGYIAALATPILWALYSTFTKKIARRKSSMKLNKLVAYFGTIELLIFAAIGNQLLILFENIFNFPLFLCGIYLGIGCYILGYYIWQKSQVTLKSFKVSSFLYIEPFITLLFSIMLNRSEIVVFWNIFGGFIVLFGVLVINYK